MKNCMFVHTTYVYREIYSKINATFSTVTIKKGDDKVHG